MTFRKSVSAVDMAAYSITSAFLILAIGVPLGLQFDVSCNPFSLTDPICSGIVWTIVVLFCTGIYLAFFMARAWWSNKESSSLSRVAWLIFGILFLPYAIVLYYWFVYRRHLSRKLELAKPGNSS